VQSVEVFQNLGPLKSHLLTFRHYTANLGPCSGRQVCWTCYAAPV